MEYEVLTLIPSKASCVRRRWFIKQLSQARPLRQMHSIGCEEEIREEAATATGYTTGSPTSSLFPSFFGLPRCYKEIEKRKGKKAQRNRKMSKRAAEVTKGGKTVL